MWGRKSGPKPGYEQMDFSKKVVKGGRVVDEELVVKQQRTTKTTGIFVFIMCLLFAWIYSAHYAETSAITSLFGISTIDTLLFGPGYGTLIGDPTIDMILTIFIRGLFFMAVFGIIPFLSAKYSKMRDLANTSPFHVVWGMTAFIFLSVTLVHSILWPLMVGISKQLSL